MNNTIYPWKIWKDIPGHSYRGRYFETSKDYKDDMIRRGESRHIRYSHINRKLTEKEEKTIVPFVENCLRYRENNYCTTRALYPHYERFCKENNLIPLIPSVFATCIKVHVFLQENIPGVLFSRTDPYMHIDIIGFFNLGLKNETDLCG